MAIAIFKHYTHPLHSSFEMLLSGRRLKTLLWPGETCIKKTICPCGSDYLKS